MGNRYYKIEGKEEPTDDSQTFDLGDWKMVA